MGTWIGHIAPGVFFVAFAFWWHINNCIRYLKSFAYEIDEKTRQQQQIKFEGSTTYPCFCCYGKSIHRLPIETILKILITSIHFTIEIITGYSSEPRPHLGDENAHHTAMLFGFFLGSWVELLVHYKVPLPKRINQVMGFLAFAIEGLMMVFHLHARSMIDAHIHQLLALTIVCSMLSAIGECFDPNNFWLIVARSFFALTQGTWFIQAAYVIWPKTMNSYFLWEPDSHRSVSLLTMSYAYHLAGNAFLLIVVYLCVYIFMSSSSSLSKLNINLTEEAEVIDEYKLIISVHEEDNEL